MPASFMPSAQEMMRFLPETLLTLAGVFLMVLEAIMAPENKGRLKAFALFALAAALAAAVIAYNDPGPAFNRLLIIDGFATFFRVLVIGVAILAVLGSSQYLAREGANPGEYWALVLFSVVGQSLMVTSNELIMIFIGLEISSIASYVLAGYLRDDARNSESALKYFLLGSFATGFLLYGVAWIYGLTGTTDLSQIRADLANRDISNSMMMIGAACALMFVGFAFKVSAAPFQVWAPDVYQGAPSPVAAFLSSGPKAAAFAMFLRVFVTAFEPVADRWEPIVWASALVTMIVGNFAALRQTNVKRLMAYSSIAHAGYVMVAVATHSKLGIEAAMFYLAAYALTNLGAFAVITCLVGKGERFVEIKDLAGLGARQPLSAAMLTIFLLSLIGVPLTGGFFGKFYIFKAALDARLIWLTVLGLLNSAVAAYYYLRILVVMYMEEPGDTVENTQEMGGALKFVLVGSAVATLVIGTFPSLLLDVASRYAVLGR
ncbi:MAG: NADH-quinone oxidoreductase subunit N [Acidobacteria bacterium]|nr:NADH-quinone oxidoreductase subunit N [Acidobacteriota bacterium]